MYALICLGAATNVKIVSQKTLKNVKNVNAKLMNPTVDDAREMVGRDDMSGELRGSLDPGLRRRNASN